MHTNRGTMLQVSKACYIMITKEAANKNLKPKASIGEKDAWSTHLKMFAKMSFDRSFYTCITVLQIKTKVTISIITMKFLIEGLANCTFFVHLT